MAMPRHFRSSLDVIILANGLARRMDGVAILAAEHASP
jgi:hypothetical protein